MRFFYLLMIYLCYKVNFFWRLFLKKRILRGKFEKPKNRFHKILIKLTTTSKKPHQNRASGSEMATVDFGAGY